MTNVVGVVLQIVVKTAGVGMIDGVEMIEVLGMIRKVSQSLRLDALCLMSLWRCSTKVG